MTSPPGPHRQSNQAANGGQINATQNGNQYISNNTTNNYTNAITHQYVKRSRTKLGWAVLILLAVDVGFFFYGQAAYTGEANNSGDLWRAGIFLALVATTGTLIRRWFRSG